MRFLVPFLSVLAISFTAQAKVCFNEAVKSIDGKVREQLQQRVNQVTVTSIDSSDSWYSTIKDDTGIIYEIKGFVIERSGRVNKFEGRVDLYSVDCSIGMFPQVRFEFGTGSVK